MFGSVKNTFSNITTIRCAAMTETCTEPLGHSPKRGPDILRKVPDILRKVPDILRIGPCPSGIYYTMSK